MIELVGDLFAPPEGVDGIVIPTNCVVRNGLAVMGRGVAAEAARRWPGLPLTLGQALQRRGPVAQGLTFRDREGQWRLFHGGNPVPFALFAYPTKYDWRDDANLELIARAALELRAEARLMGCLKVALPRVGCGLGKLEWYQVRRLIHDTLDDTFVVLTP